MTPVLPPDIGQTLQSCRERLLAFIRRRVPRKEDVEDILQEISCRFIRVNALFRPVEQASAWLYRAAKNEIIDRSRKKTEIPLSDRGTREDDWTLDEEFAEVLFGTSRSPEEEYLSELAWAEIEAALAELPDAQREVFEKTEFQGLSYKKIATESGVPINTLLSRKHKAVRHLRQRLQDLHDDVMRA